MGVGCRRKRSGRRQRGARLPALLVLAALAFLLSHFDRAHRIARPRTPNGFPRAGAFRGWVFVIGKGASPPGRKERSVVLGGTRASGDIFRSPERFRGRAMARFAAAQTHS